MRAFNSSIRVKEKICISCGKPCFWFSKKRCQQCARIEDAMAKDEREVFEQKDKPIKGGAELNRWFKERRLEMKGICANCGKPSCKHDDKYFKYSIAHILPKAYFPSVATHPANWIELCFWGNSCHTNMDNKTLDLTEMNCWDLIVTRFQEMYPMIDKKERRRIPAVLLQYINVDI